MPGVVGRGWGVAVLAVGLLAGPIAAQLPPVPDVQQPAAGPGSIAWPSLASPTVPSPPVPPPSAAVLDTPRGAFTTVPPPAVGTRPVDLAPLPGSLEDDIAQEYAARQLFRLCTWRGTTVEAFPTSLLWQPPFASKREPRMLLSPTNLDNPSGGNWTLDTSIGGVFGMWRAKPAGSDLQIQFDIGAVVHTRLSPEDLLASDYRFAFPLTFARGPWHAKVAYEHTSAHIGDEYLRNGILRTGLVPPIPSWAKDEVVVGLGRWFEDRLRLYGQISYAFLLDVPGLYKSPWRFDVGFEYYCPAPTGWSGTPFVAANMDSRGDQGYNPNVNAQVGWLWRNPFQRLANVRLFVEYYNGRSPYGQFYLNRERFVGLGFSGDY